MADSVVDVHTAGTNSNVEILEQWNKYEKLDLLYALKSFGSRDIKQIHESIPAKSPEQIQAAIDHYKRKAIKQKEASEKRKGKSTRNNSKPRIPLAIWAKYLTDSLTFKELQTETSTAVRLIADLEKFPPAVCTENIDFKKIYHYMANVMEGKPVPEDKMIDTLFKKCVVETALVSKAFLRSSTFRFLVNSLNVAEKDINIFPKPTDDHELATLRHLMSQRSYNPLNIPEEFVKPSSSSSDY